MCFQSKCHFNFEAVRHLKRWKCSMQDFCLSKQFCPQQNVGIKTLYIPTKYHQRPIAWPSAPERWGLATPKPYLRVPARGTRKTSCLESKEWQEETWFMGAHVSQALGLRAVLSRPSHTGGRGSCPQELNLNNQVCYSPFSSWICQDRFCRMGIRELSWGGGLWQRSCNIPFHRARWSWEKTSVYGLYWIRTIST